MDILQAAQTAGMLAERSFTNGLETERKDDGTLVTNADLAVSQHLMTFCADFLPTTIYLGEENQAGPKNAEQLLVVDEIDGTSSFIDGGKDCSIIMGLAKRRAIRCHTDFDGVVINNFREGDTGWCFLAEDGRVWLAKNNERPFPLCMKRDVSRDRSIVSIATWKTALHNLNDAAAILTKTGFKVQYPGGIGSQAGRLITNKIDALIFPGEDRYNGKNSWHEVGPMQFLLETAGAVCTDLAGNELVFDEIVRENGYPDFKLRCGFAASRNHEVHERLISTIAPFLDR